MNSNDLLKLLKDICEENDLELRSYSGRYMYGAECYGVTVESEFQFKEMVREKEGITAKQIKDLLNYKIDNMGNDKIIYYPNLPYEDEEQGV